MIPTSNQSYKEAVLLAECLQGNRKAQEQLYNQYSPTMYAVCMRYAGNANDAQDILQDGFIKVFKNLEKFRGEGSFEGWMRRIFVYTAIESLRRKKYQIAGEPETLKVEDKELTGYDNIAMKDLLKLIQQLPAGYRTVVNLFLIEGYGHKEIADMLGVTEGTSKSQLARAKAILQKQIIQLSST